MKSDYTNLLVSIFGFMRKSGFRDVEVKDICRRALAAGHNRECSDDPRCAMLAAAALVLDAWHRNRRYLDGTQPRAIPLLGRSPSVESLIRSQATSNDPAALARRFRSIGLVVRSGKKGYKPSDRIALVNGLDPMIHQYVARTSATLLATIRHNTSQTRASPRLIERFAEVPDLPQKKAAEFRRFAQTQGWAFLRTLNDWLESRRAGRSSGRYERTVRAGVHLYAYVDAPPKKALGKRRESRPRR